MPVSSAPDMYVPQEGNPFQRILGRLKKQQGAEASAAEQVEEPEAMIGEDTPSMPAAPRRIPLPTEKEGKPFMMPSTEEPPAEDAGSAAEMLEGKPAMPDPEPGSLMDRTQPQKWQGRGGYNYSYAPPKGDKPATITIHQMGQGYSPVTISADGPKADAFSKILKEFTEIEGTEEHGAYEEFEPRRKRPTMQQAVESAAEELAFSSESQQPDIRESQQEDLRESQQPDIRESQQADLRESQQPDIRESQQPDIRESQQEDLRESQQPDTRESQQVREDSRVTKDPEFQRAMEMLYRQTQAPPSAAESADRLLRMGRFDEAEAEVAKFRSRLPGLAAQYQARIDRARGMEIGGKQ